VKTLIWLSGADPDTLSRSPRERRKYSGLGGIVLTTSCMAALSAAFAIRNGMRAPLWAAIPIAVLWGLAIANLDRWLVAAAARRDKWWQNLTMLVPRLLLALVIGAVVSTPLVLWIFQREIEAQVTQTQQDNRDRFEKDLRADARFAGLPQLEADVARLQRVANGTLTDDLASRDPEVARAQKEFDELDKRYSAAQASAVCEFDGTCGTRHRGGGSAYQTKLKVANELRTRRDAAKSTLDAARSAVLARQDKASGSEQAAARDDLGTKQAELARLTAQKQREQDQFLADSADDRGLLAQLEALSTITNRNATLKLAYLTLLLFITAVEIMPVLTKFLLNIGPSSAYDKILAEAEDRDVATARTSFAYEREQHEERLKARAEKQRERVDEVAEHEVAVQTELRRRELDDLRAGRTATAPTRRWGLRFPGQRRDAADDPSYTQWPAEEPTTRPMGAERTGTAAPPPAEEGDTGPRWRFN
jgi:hypothetical protein